MLGAAFRAERARTFGLARATHRRARATGLAAPLCAGLLAGATPAIAAGADRAFAARPSVRVRGAALAPELGRRELITPVSGRVSVRAKGAHRFTRISRTTSVPDGSEVEASAGRARVTVAGPQPGQTERALAYGGRFELHQQPLAPEQTRFTLSGSLSGCVAGAARARGSSRAHAAHRRRRSIRRELWVSESGGSWGSEGRYISTSVEGTRWLTIDECGRSEVKVAEGEVQVTDLIHHTTTTLSAGGTYTAAHGANPPAPAFAPVYLDTLPRTGGEEVVPGVVSVAGVSYAHGIQMEVSFAMDREEAEYTIPTGAHTFTAVIGNDDNQTNELWNQIPLLYEVFVDGRRAAIAHAQGSASEPLAPSPVAGGHTLKLVVINDDDAGGGTRADWGEPLFS